MRIVTRYVDDSGAGVPDASVSVRALDLLTGEHFSFGAGTWGTRPDEGALAPDAHEDGTYVLDVDEVGWGTRVVRCSLFLEHSTLGNKEDVQTYNVIAGAVAVLVPVVPPPAGRVNVVCYIRDSTGIPAVAPQGWLWVFEGPANPAECAGPVAGTWDPVAGALVWTVPEGTPIFRVSVPQVGVWGYWAAALSTVILNTAQRI